MCDFRQLILFHYYLQYLVTELNNTMSEIKISLHGLNNRMQMIEKRASDLEDSAIKMIKSWQ